ncbi:metallopeptidase TldD-related protein [Propionibacterium acidifaciens]|nr:metallopeptidase TldD-related protein [Propionibacterium acidifaciens]
MFERLYSYVEESACLPVLTGSRCTRSHLRGVLLPPRSAGFFFHETLGHMLEADVRGLYPGENLIGMDERINVIDDVRGNEHLIGLAEVDDLACTMSPVSLVEQGHVRRLISIEYTMNGNSSSDGFARASTCFEKPVPRMRVTQVLPVSPSDSDTLDLDGHWFSLEHALQGSVTPGTGEFKIIGSGFHMMNGERIGFNGSIMITGRLENILRKLVHIGSESSVYAADCGKMGQAVRVGYGAPMTALSGSTLKLAEPGAEN